MSIAEKIRAIQSQTNQEVSVQQQEREHKFQEAEKFIENVVRSKFEEVNREVLQEKGKIFRNDTLEKIVILIEWVYDSKKWEEYRLTLEAGISKPYVLYPGEAVKGLRRSVNPDSPKCEEDLEDAIANCIANNECEWSPYYPSSYK